QSRSIVLDSIDPPHELASIKKDLSKLLDTKQIQCLTIKKAREKLTALSLNQAFDLGHKKEEIILGVSLDFQKKLISADIPKKIKILLQNIEEKSSSKEVDAQFIHHLHQEIKEIKVQYNQFLTDLLQLVGLLF